MNRQQLEHVLRAAADIADDDEIVVIGSQAILAQFPNAPPALCASHDVDLYPKNHPERAELVEGSIGELSPFHETFGYYVHGVAPETAVLPAGWQGRLVAISGPGTRGATGWCLDVHDLAVSKAIAGREKDLDYLSELARHGLANAAAMLERLAATDLTPGLRQLVEQRIRRIFRA
jgi:hypothetical protein